MPVAGRKTGLMFYIIDPLKADVQALTNVMSQEYALRNRILAVEIQPYKVLIATDQPYKTEWVSNLEQNIAPKKLNGYCLIRTAPALYC